MIKKKIWKNIITIGSNIDGHGGISELLRSYRGIFEKFEYVRATCKGNIFKRTWVYFCSVLKLIVKCTNRELKIVHIHSSSFILLNKTAIYIIIAHLLRKKIILHLHGGALESVCQKHEKMLRWLFSYVHVIICVSKFIKDIVDRYGLNDNSVVVYNIINRPNLEKKSTKGNEVNFLFLGKVCDEKGIFDVIDTIIENKDYFEGKMILNVAGWGDIQHLENLISNFGANNLIHYLGWIEKDEKTKYLNGADVYIQPTYFESLGIAMIEAMSYNLPVISTNVGGVPEIVQDGKNGFLVDPKDKKMIFEKMKLLIETPQLRETMGIEGCNIAERFYDSKIEEDLLKIYTSLI